MSMSRSADMSYLPCNSLSSPLRLSTPKLSPKETPLSPKSKTHNINTAANRATRRAAAGPNARAAPPVNGDDELEPVGENGLDEDPRVPDELRLEGMELTTVVVGNGGITVEWVAVEDAGRLLWVAAASALEVEAGALEVAGSEAGEATDGGVDVMPGAEAAHSHTAAAAD